MPGRGSTPLNREGSYWKTLRLVTGHYAMSHKQGNPVLAVRNFCDHIIPNISSPKSSGCSPLDYYVWGTVEQETNKTPCNTK